MGWDAFAAAEISKGKGFKLKHKRHREAFKAAHEEVLKNADSVDGGLDAGVLGSSACRDMLQKAFNGNVSVYSNWTPEQTKQAQKLANWNFKYSKEDAWAYWSAKIWLRVCAENDLGVEFSY